MPCRKPRERTSTPGSGSWMVMVLPNQTLRKNTYKSHRSAYVGIYDSYEFMELVQGACETHQSNSIKQHQPATAQPQGLKLLQHPLDVGPEVTLHVVQLRLHASSVQMAPAAGAATSGTCCCKMF